MRIGAFAQLNHVTTKLLRHYDEIGLFSPESIDCATGYRQYTKAQSKDLQWILILRELDFSLAEIKEIRNGQTETDHFLRCLREKKFRFHSQFDRQMRKLLLLDQLIRYMEREGFGMNASFTMADLDDQAVLDMKKNIPSMDVFYEKTKDLLSLCKDDGTIAVFRMDIRHFKSVNDDYGYETGDRVLLRYYQIFAEQIHAALPNAVIGRNHGDEFLAFAPADDREAVTRAARAITRDGQGHDMTAQNCPRVVHCALGVLISRKPKPAQLNDLLQQAFDLVEQSRQKGNWVSAIS